MTGQKHPHAHPHPHGRVRSSVVPEYDMNIVSRYTFSYVSALIGFGASATSTSTSTTASTSTSSAEGHSGTCIDIEDIPHVPYNQTSEMTDEAFDKPWNEELRLNPVNPNIRKALFITHGYWFWLAFLNVIIFIFLSAIQPFFVSMLLAYVSSDDVDFVGMGSGYGIALFLGISSLVNAFILNSAMYYCYYFGMAIKSSLIARIFRKALLISNCVKENRSVGDIITLMSVDVERIWYATLLLPWLILSPIMILVSIILLLIKMSYAALLVCVFIILLGVLLEHVSKRIGKIRVEIVKHTVERTLLVNETLQGIRVVKMYAWEDIIQKKIETVRRKEVLLLRKYLVLKMIGVILPFIAPSIMSYALFVTYSKLGGDLSIQVVYTAMAIMNISRFPVEILPLARVSWEEGCKSIKRIRDFLILPENPSPHDDDYDKIFVDEAGVQMKRLGNCGISNDILVSIVGASFAHGSSKVPTENHVETVVAERQPYESVKSVDTTGDIAVTLCDDDNQSDIALSDINLTIQKGEMVAIVGSVGSGKSSLLSAILKQMQCVKGSQNLCGNVAYVSQEHWIQNKTLRDNVLFFNEYDEDKYIEAIDASQLSSDLMMLPNADFTVIGERGINLSGGQKARVNIARALYAKDDVDLIVLDDPLAAVDAHVGKAIFEEAIMGTLKDKARVVVFSSNYHFLSEFDKIIVVGKQVLSSENENSQDSSLEIPFVSSIQVFSSVNDLIQTCPQYSTQLSGEQRESHHDCDATTRTTRLDSTGSTEEDVSLLAAITASDVGHDVNDQHLIRRAQSMYRRVSSTIQQKQVGGKAADLMGNEDRKHGSVSLGTVTKYYSAAVAGKNGTFILVVVLFLFCCVQVIKVMGDLWIGIWARYEQGDNTDSGEKSTLYYIVVLTILLGAIIFATLCRSYYFLYACVGASANLHRGMLESVLSASVNKYFDVTPIGRILNRFTKDMDVIDSLLPDYLLMALQGGFHIIAILILCLASTPYFFIAFFPIMVLFYFLQRHFRLTSRELKRLDGISRSPIYNHLSETLNGLATIRAYGKQDTFLRIHHDFSNDNKRCFFAFNVCNRWLSLRLDVICAGVVLMVSFIAVIMVNMGSAVDENVLGLAIVYSIQLLDSLQWTARVIIETENNLTSVERLLAFNEIEKESLSASQNSKLSDSWPSDGRVRITDLSMRYRNGLPLVLKRISLDVPGGCKLGICGRTGSGKSSLVLALLRLVEPEEDSVIEIDGENILNMDLHTLRSRITVIPQDPVMFSGTLRINLDPFDQYSDEAIWESLERAHLKDDIIAKFPQKLKHSITEKGENVSVGQRQLLCIARALLKKSKLIVMDEATASVDSTTDRKIQETIATEFAHCTVITIAHRLETIMDYDKVLVMDEGNVAEMGTPKELLQKKNGKFANLARELA